MLDFFQPESETGIVALLKADHREVEALFDALEHAEGAAQKLRLAQQVCDALALHAAAEELHFYAPARAQASGHVRDLLDEAEVEHASLEALIAGLDGGSAGDALFDARLTVLREYVKHHVKEEERELIPQVYALALDLEALGRDFLAAKQSLRPKAGKAGSNKVRVHWPTAARRSPPVRPAPRLSRKPKSTPQKRVARTGSPRRRVTAQRTARAKRRVAPKRRSGTR